jgi:hypothetical protein
MALRIARPVFELAVRLIGWLRVDACPGRMGVSEVCTNIRDVHDKPGTGHAHRLRRTELVLSGNAVKPNGGPTDSDFAMDWLAVSRALDSGVRRWQHVR